MNVEGKFQVPISIGQRKVYAPDKPSVSTSEISNTTTFLGVVGYQQAYLTGQRTGSNETNTYPTIRTHRLSILTGDILKENTKKGYSPPELENLSRIRSVRSSLRTQKGVHTAKGRTCYVLKSELIREEHLN